jgi:hypothetical protein
VLFWILHSVNLLGLDHSRVLFQSVEKSMGVVSSGAMGVGGNGAINADFYRMSVRAGDVVLNRIWAAHRVHPLPTLVVFSVTNLFLTGVLCLRMPSSTCTWWAMNRPIWSRPPSIAKFEFGIPALARVSALCIKYAHYFVCCVVWVFQVSIQSIRLLFIVVVTGCFSCSVAGTVATQPAPLTSTLYFVGVRQSGRPVGEVQAARHALVGFEVHIVVSLEI